MSETKCGHKICKALRLIPQALRMCWPILLICLTSSEVLSDIGQELSVGGKLEWVACQHIECDSDLDIGKPNVLRPKGSPSGRRAVSAPARVSSPRSGSGIVGAGASRSQPVNRASTAKPPSGASTQPNVTRIPSGASAMRSAAQPSTKPLTGSINAGFQPGGVATSPRTGDTTALRTVTVPTKPVNAQTSSKPPVAQSTGPVQQGSSKPPTRTPGMTGLTHGPATEHRSGGVPPSAADILRGITSTMNRPPGLQYPGVRSPSHGPENEPSSTSNPFVVRSGNDPINVGDLPMPGDSREPTRIVPTPPPRNSSTTLLEQSPGMKPDWPTMSAADSPKADPPPLKRPQDLPLVHGQTPWDPPMSLGGVQVDPGTRDLLTDHAPGAVIKVVAPELSGLYTVTKALYGAAGSSSALGGAAKFEKDLLNSAIGSRVGKVVSDSPLVQHAVSQGVKAALKTVEDPDTWKNAAAKPWSGPKPSPGAWNSIERR
jgi:hypothetical protein